MVDRLNSIRQFDGEYQFLSNFYPSKVSWLGVEYPTVEHAYQAAKSLDHDIREQFASISSPGKAKKLGRTIELREDWESIKISVMRNLLSQKFRDEDMFKKLKATAPKELIEGNWWGDVFGVFVTVKEQTI
jgi:ribA/ribD-fused uncharacterized protein